MKYINSMFPNDDDGLEHHREEKHFNRAQISPSTKHRNNLWQKVNWIVEIQNNNAECNMVAVTRNTILNIVKFVDKIAI